MSKEELFVEALTGIGAASVAFIGGINLLPALTLLVIGALVTWIVVLIRDSGK